VNHTSYSSLPNNRKRFNKRNNNRRSKRSRRSIRNVPRVTGHVAPNQFRTRVAYSVNYQASSAGTLSANSGYFQFTANSVYNPDLQVILERFPIGIAQWSHLYQRYYVEACTMKVSVQPIAGITAAEGHWIIAAHPYTSSIPAGAQTATDFMGQPFCSPLKTAGPISNVTFMRQRFSSAQMLSRPGSQIHNSEPTSGFLNSATYQPIDQWFWTIVFTNSTAAATFPALAFQFTMEMDIVLFQNGWANLALHSTAGAFVESTPETDFCVCPPLLMEEHKDPPQVQGHAL